MASDGSAPNLLIISDLHLGEDIKPGQTGFLRHVVMLERELTAFLEHYTVSRLDGRPWRLVINGDMVDFLGVCVLPQEGERWGDDAGPLGPIDIDEEDRVYGLGTRPRAARMKLERVLERHAGVFRALARFVGAGNHLSVIAGNHDVEFHWPIVQEALRAGIVKLWAAEPRSRRAGARTPEEVGAAITFHPWFYFEENVAWVEHGHQYDDYCSFDYILNPVEPAEDRIVHNVGSAALHYVGNHMKGAQQADSWSFVGYLQLTLAQGLRGIGKIARGYWAMAFGLLTLWRVFLKQPDKVAARRRTHRERLRALAAQVKLSEETLVALDDLRQRPVVLNFARLLMALMLDRLLVVSVTAILVLGFVIALPWAWAIGGVVAVLAAAWGVSSVLERARSCDPVAKMGAAPRQIRRHVSAPYIVFGHSHDPVAVPLEGGGMYFNTGTWVATERPGLLRAFTHLMIRHGAAGPQAGLYQWRDGRSHAFRD